MDDNKGPRTYIIMRMLMKGDVAMTTQEWVEAVGGTRQNLYLTVAKLEEEGLVWSSRKRIPGGAQVMMTLGLALEREGVA